MTVAPLLKRGKTVIKRGYRAGWLVVGLLAWTGLTQPVVAFDTQARDFVLLEEEYRQLFTRQQETRAQILQRVLQTNRDRSAERLAQDQAANNPHGVAVATEAIALVDTAMAQLEQYGSLNLPERVRSELEDFVQAMRRQEELVNERHQEQRERLRTRTLRRFSDAVHLQDPEATEEEIETAFEAWLAPIVEELTAALEEEQAPPEPERLTAAGIGLDIYAADFEALKGEIREQWDLIDRGRRRLLTRALTPQREAAEARAAEARRTRNVRAMAVENQAVSLLDEALASVEQDGRMELPESVRPELEWLIAALNAEVEAVDAQVAERTAEIEAQFLERFNELVAQQPGVEAPEAALLEIFTAWARGDDMGPALAGGDTGGEGPSPADRLYFDQRGEGQDWFTVGRWEVDTPGIDIFEIPVYDGRDRRETQVNRMLRVTAEWSYQHQQTLERGTPYAYRLRRVRDRDIVTVVEWPSQRNEWKLVVRTGRAAGRYGFELQAAAMDVAPGSRMVDVPVVTDPEGAQVYINGDFYFEPGGDSRTPLTLKLPPDEVEVTLVRDGYLSKQVGAFRVREGATIRHRFQHPGDLPGETVVITPGASWVKTQVEVDTGDTVWLLPTGEWRIGAQGEMTGPGGYPRDRFPHYYETDLRKSDKAPYGALLFKIAEEYYGAPSEVEDRRALPLTGPRRVTASTWGPLWFDVNELEDEALRRGNSGRIEVKVIVHKQGQELPLDTRRPGFNSF